MLTRLMQRLCCHYGAGIIKPLVFAPILQRKLPCLVCQQFHQKSTSAMLRGQPNVLAELIDVSYKQAYLIVQNSKSMQKMDPDRLRKAAATLEKFGIDKESVRKYPKCLIILPVTIEQHTLCLKECGFPVVDANILIMYSKIVNRDVRLLKVHGFLPEDANVIENLLSCVEAPDDVRQNVAKEIPNPDEMSIFQIQRAVIRHYLQYRLGITEEELDHIFKTYKRLQHKSLRLMNETLYLLEHDIGFSKEKIRKHGYLLHSHPENTQNTLKTIKSIGGVKTRDILQAFPKLIMSPTETLVKTTQYLKEFGISNEAIQKCLQVFTLASDSVRERLNVLKKTPELTIYLNHPRVLRLVFHHNQANIRLQYLKNIHMKGATLHVLSAPQAIFERFVNDGGEKTRGSDIVHLVASTLIAPKKDVRNIFLKHPYWCNIPILFVKETLLFLLEQGFSRKQMLENLHIVLYPKAKVMQHLDKLPNKEELQPFDRWEKSDYILTLCLYFIEREHHFSGDGVWSVIDKVTYSDVESSLPMKHG